MGKGRQLGTQLHARRRARALAVHETSALVGEQRDAQPDAVGERHTDSALRTEPVIAAIIRLDISVEAVRWAARAQVHNACGAVAAVEGRSEEHTSALQSLMRTSYAVFCLII